VARERLPPVAEQGIWESEGAHEAKELPTVGQELTVDGETWVVQDVVPDQVPPLVRAVLGFAAQLVSTLGFNPSSRRAELLALLWIRPRRVKAAAVEQLTRSHVDEWWIAIAAPCLP
jgi:hypothetical protein